MLQKGDCIAEFSLVGDTNAASRYGFSASFVAHTHVCLLRIQVGCVMCACWAQRGWGVRERGVVCWCWAENGLLTQCCAMASARTLTR